MPIVQISETAESALSESMRADRDRLISRAAAFRLLTAVTLIMAAGWGIRGAFGHSRGAMMPGAMLGLSLSACSMRADWWRRGAVIGFLTAIGWGFGGTSSYGLLIGYSQGGTLVNSIYGYTGLFLVGALYCGIGASLLALGLTAPRSLLDRFLWPLILIYVTWLLLDWTGATDWSLARYAIDEDAPTKTRWLYDTLWLHAAAALLIGIVLYVLVPGWRAATSLIILLSGGWYLSMFLLIDVFDLRINPSRGDAWAGNVGLLCVLLWWHSRRQNRAAVMLTMYGLISGGLGFSAGEFIQALGRAEWGPIGWYPILQEFGYWTVMEQTLGAAMGTGISLGTLRLINGNLTAPEEDAPRSWFNEFSVFVLLGALFAFNFRVNFLVHWLKSEQVTAVVLGLSSGRLLSGVLIMILSLLAVALYRQRYGLLDLAPASARGKNHLLALLVIWMAMAIYIMLPRTGLPTSLMFFAELGAGTLMLLLCGGQSLPVNSRAARSPAAREWLPGWKHALLWALIPLILAGLGWCTVQLKLPVRQIRFPESTA